jgi:hypothetical protein
MNDNREQQQQDQQSGEQNPTLNAPGAKVADYGAPTGGSSVENKEQSQGGSNPQRSNGSGPENNSGTIGNP